MRKTGIFISCLLIMLGMLAACNEESNFSGNYQEGIVSFTSVIGGSRASDTQFDTGDAISVFATTSSTGQLSSTANYADNQRYSYLNTKFIAQGTGIEKPDDGKKIYYHAVYPYNQNIASQFTFRVSENQSTQSGYTASDLMTAFTESPTSEALVPLKFSHRLSKVIINIVDRADIPSGNLTLTLVNVYGNVKVDLNTQMLVASGNKYNVMMGSNGTSSFKAILPPQNITSGTVLAQLVAGNKKYDVKMIGDLSLKSGDAQTLYLMKSGDEYIIGTNKEDDRLESIVPSDIQEKMKPYINIYNGINPPNIQGVYVMEPATVVYCSDNGYAPGEVMDTEQFLRFSNQNFVKNTIDAESAEILWEDSELVAYTIGEGAFISGSGNNFTAYFKIEGKTGDIYIRGAYLISGTKSSYGIQNCMMAFTLIEKGPDPEGEVMDTGTIRIFKDGNGIADKANWPLTNRARSVMVRSNINSIFSK